MDVRRILKLAHDAARELWYRYQKELEAMPGNSIRKHRAEKAYEEMKELEQIIRAWKESHNYV